MSAGYTVGAWSGLPNYSCEICPYATTDRETMIEHVFIHRRPPLPLARVSSYVLGPDGRPAPIPSISKPGEG